MMTWLWAETKYQVCGYADNVYGNTSDGSVAYFATTSNDNNYNWEVSAQGSNTTGIDMVVVRDIVSYAQGVNPDRNININVVYTAPTARRLQTTHTYKWTGTLASDRSVESPTTQSFTTLSASDSSYVSTEMSTVLGANFVVSPYANSAYAATQPTVAWTTSPNVKSKTTNSVTIGFGCDNNNGQVACVVLNEQSQSTYESNNDMKPSAE